MLILGQSAPLLANPTGGAVVAGAATIGSAGKTLNINQASNTAIINWQSFSIASGETTKFFVPTSSSATLNRVTGGNPSAIYGTLSSNGQLYLINPSGIVVGASGRIDTSSFLGSTLDVSNDEFLKGAALHFSGDSTAAVDNQGVITAGGGDVYLIANQVSNEGSLTAPKGDVGLAAGSGVLLQQAGDQHLFVEAGPTDPVAAGVTNSGAIQAATAELRAAGGNAYALAINNSGSIAASGFQKIDGQVYLTDDTGGIVNSGAIHATGAHKGGTVKLTSNAGTVTNSGFIDASATARGGKGGSVLLSSTQGSVINTGGIDAKGGATGAGGVVEVSGLTVDPEGVVNTLAAGGRAGMFIIDPATLTIAPAGGDETGAEVSTDLATSNVTLSASNTILINDSITWTSANTLTLQISSTGTGGESSARPAASAPTSAAIQINDPISGVNGTLVIDAEESGNQITTGSSGSIDVGSFVLENGFWNQNSATLPAFAATNDFELQNESVFIRVTGGDGSSGSPYQITDIYGLQGLGSPSQSLLTSDAELVSDIDASVTANWRSGQGFSPIGYYDGDSGDSNTYSASFNGQTHTISNLTIDEPTAVSVGLFGDTAPGSVIENLNLTNAHVSGDEYVGGVVGVCNSYMTDVTSSGVVTGQTYVGGLDGISAGYTLGSSASGTVTGASGSTDVGGLIGFLQQAGSGTVTISQSYSSATVTGTDSYSVGGLVGINDGAIIEQSYASGAVTVPGGSQIGGLVGDNQGNITNCYSTSNVSAANTVGGLVGYSGGGVISTSYASGSVTGTSTVGGLVGQGQDATIADCYYNSADGTSAGIGVDSGDTITYLGVAAQAVTGLTPAQLKMQSSFDSNWDFTNIWSTNGDTTSPVLIGVGEGMASTGTGGTGTTTPGGDTLDGTAYTDGGITIAPGVTIDLLYDGSLIGTTTTNSSGDFTFSFSSTDLSTGLLLTDATDKGNTFFQSGSTNTTFSGVDVWGSTLRVLADNASNAMLKAAIGSLSGNGINYGVSGSNLTTAAGVDIDIVSNYTVDGNMTAAGTFTTETGADLTGSADATLQGTSVTIQGTFDRGGSLTLKSTNGEVEVTGVGSSDTPAAAVGLTLDATGGPAILDTSYVDLGGGSLTMSGTGSGTTLDGVDLFATTVDAQGGSITLTGHAGYDSDSTDAGVGVSVDGSTLMTSGTGSFTLSGNGSIGTSGSPMADTGLAGTLLYESTLTTGSGAIKITGTVASGTSSEGVDGVEMNDSIVQVTQDGGSITITGNSAGSTADDSSNAGAEIYCNGDNGLSTLDGGGIQITGTAGAVVLDSSFSGPAGAYGFTMGSNLSTTGSAPIVLTGTGGTVTDHSTGNSIQSNGADFYSASTGTGGENEDTASYNTETISTQGGDITIHGTGGSSDNAGIGVAMFAYSDSPLEIQSATGNIAITGVGGPGDAGTAAESPTFEPNGGVAIGDNVSITATGGNVSIVGTGQNGFGIKIAPFANYLNGTTEADSDPLTPTVTAGGTLTLTTMSGAIETDATLVAAGTSINSAGDIVLDNSQEGTALNTDTLDATSGGATDIDGLVETDGTATVVSTGGNIVFGAGGTITDTGTGNSLTLAAGTSLAHSHYIVNDSEAGADGIQALDGAKLYLYSADPTNDHLNGVEPTTTVYSASYPSSAPTDSSGNLYYVAGPTDVGPNAPNGGGGGGTGGGGTGGGGTTPPSGTDTASSEDGSGSNIVPPAVVPQDQDVQPPTDLLGDIWGGTALSPVNFSGAGMATQTGLGVGGLADTTGNGGQIGAGDSAQVGGGLNNVHNAAAQGELNLALSPEVQNALLLALGTWTSIDTSGQAGAGGDATTETMLNSGDVVVIGGGSVKAVPANQIPAPLKKALGNNVLGGMPGH